MKSMQLGLASIGADDSFGDGGSLDSSAPGVDPAAAGRFNSAATDRLRRLQVQGTALGEQWPADVASAQVRMQAERLGGTDRVGTEVSSAGSTAAAVDSGPAPNTVGAELAPSGARRPDANAGAAGSVPARAPTGTGQAAVASAPTAAPNSGVQEDVRGAPQKNAEDALESAPDGDGGDEDFDPDSYDPLDDPEFRKELRGMWEAKGMSPPSELQDEDDLDLDDQGNPNPEKAMGNLFKMRVSQFLDLGRIPASQASTPAASELMRRGGELSSKLRVSKGDVQNSTSAERRPGSGRAHTTSFSGFGPSVPHDPDNSAIVFSAGSKPKFFSRQKAESKHAHHGSKPHLTSFYLDCNRATNVFYGFLSSIQCGLLSHQWARKSYVDILPNDPNCFGNIKLIMDRKTSNWNKCCVLKSGLKGPLGPMYCQHITPTVQIPPYVQIWRPGFLFGAIAALARRILRLVVVPSFDRVGQFITGNASYVDPDYDNEPVQMSYDQKNTLCFNVTPNNRYTKEGCHCWKGVEECYNLGKAEQSMPNMSGGMGAPQRQTYSVFYIN